MGGGGVSGLVVIYHAELNDDVSYGVTYDTIHLEMNPTLAEAKI